MSDGAVILLGPPRSGTTLLFETLGRSSRLWSMGKESHDLLEGPFHPSRRDWSSNALVAADLDDATAADLRRAFHAAAQPGDLRRGKDARRAGAGSTTSLRWTRISTLLRRTTGSVRLLEKTPKNCLRIPFLRRLFPDARFVFLRRDGRPTVSSLMDGWRAPSDYETYEPPVPLRIPGYDGTNWCFVLPPRWRELVDRPLEEVCAEQWAACAEAVLDALPGLRADGVVHEIAYEDLVARPREVLQGTLAWLRIPWEDELLPGGDRLEVVNAVTPPDPDKWRRRNGEAVARILPRIAAAQEALGYPATP